VIFIALLLCIGGGIWWYMSTNTVRRYKAQTKEVYLVADRLKSQIEVFKLNRELDRLKVETPIIAPTKPDKRIEPLLPEK